MDIARWVFVGDAGGSISALLYALRYPQQLAGLIIGFTAPSIPQVVADERSILSPQHPRNRLVELGTRVPAQPAQQTSYWVELPDGRWLWQRNGQPTLFWPYGFSDRVRTVWEEIITFDVLHKLSAIQVPTLVLAGGRDELVPVEHPERLARLIPGAEFIVLQRSTHEVADEDFILYRTALQRFMAERVST